MRLDPKKIAGLVQQNQRFMLRYLYPGSVDVYKNWTAAELTPMP